MLYIYECCLSFIGQFKHPVSCTSICGQKLSFYFLNQHFLSYFPGGSAGKESTCNWGGLGLIPGLGRSPGEGKGYPLQYSGLARSMNYTVHGVAKNQTWLSDFLITSLQASMYLWIYICMYAYTYFLFVCLSLISFTANQLGENFFLRAL